MRACLPLRLSALIAACVASFVLAACGEDVPPPAPPVLPPVRPPAPIVAARPISTRVAFDLIAVPDGAALVWGVPVDDGGGVQAIALDPLGGARAREVVITRRGVAAGTGSDEGPALVEDVVATAAGTRVAIAWIVRRGATVRAQSAISSAGLDGLSPTSELGITITIPLDGITRGRLAAWTLLDGTAVFQHRLEPAACQGSDGTCARIGQTRADGDPLRGLGVMEVLTPCDPLIVGAVTARDAWYHGTCHVDAQGRTATTLYALQPAIELASAPDLLVGCAPVGVAPGPLGAIAVGRCADGIVAQQIDANGQIPTTVRGATPRTTCESGRPVISIEGTGGPLLIALTESASRIESLLPETMAPAGARAVWTGESILVATVAARDVALRRYECEGDALVRTDTY